MNNYEEMMIRIIVFADEDIVRTSVNGNDNQGAWDNEWDREDPDFK